MKLGDGVEAAIHSVAVLAGMAGNTVMPAAALATYHGISASYLVKHLKALVQQGILVSVPGPNGGYRLARLADEITLLDIVLAVEGAEPAFRCLNIRRGAPDAPGIAAYPNICGINAAMLAAERVYRAALATSTIGDIARGYEAESEPEVIAHGCRFRDLYQREQTNHIKG
jgi:Rrf2 family protein